MILILEDEMIIAYDIKGILEAEGFTAQIITDFRDPVGTILALKPDLVLLDINIKSTIDGVDIAEQLLDQDNIPFIYITSYYDKVTLDRVKNTRPYGFITKPFKNIDVISTISIVLNNFNHRKIDSVREDEALNTEVPYFLKLVVAHINDHIKEKIDVIALAKMSKWNYHHFIRIFKTYLGSTPYQYILKKKIDNAKALLTESNLSTTQIAYEVGFESYVNFCNAFKKNTTLTPKEYRERKFGIKN